MRDNMLINTSGINDQWMGVDMNIEHLINFLKVTVIVACRQRVYLPVFRRCSLQKGFTHLGTALAIFQPQAMSCVLPRSALDGS